MSHSPSGSKRNSLASVSSQAHDHVTTRPTIFTSHSHPPSQPSYTDTRDRSSRQYALGPRRNSGQFQLQSAPLGRTQSWRNSVTSLQQQTRSISRLSEPIIHESDHSDPEEEDLDAFANDDPTTSSRYSYSYVARTDYDEPTTSSRYSYVAGTDHEDPTVSSRYSYISRSDIEDTTIRYPLRNPAFDRISGHHNRVSMSLPGSRSSSRSQHYLSTSPSAPASASRPSSPLPPPSPALSQYSMHAIATPQPTLMFAIASDDPDEVRRVLESGEVGPNDQVGPQSALAFAVGNERLKRKVEIVKTLLAYGADPKGLQLGLPPETSSRRSSIAAGALAEDSRSSSSMSTLGLAEMMESMDPATRYYVARADAAHTRKTSALIHRSFFRPLTRVRFDIVGQDRAFEQLFMVLNAHSKKLSVAPIVVLLCGKCLHI